MLGRRPHPLAALLFRQLRDLPALQAEALRDRRHRARRRQQPGAAASLSPLLLSPFIAPLLLPPPPPQVGFTTDPSSSRSTLHCTDIGRAFDVPIFHVNADEPEAVVRAFEMAADYRAAFSSDVIVEIVGYRKQCVGGGEGGGGEKCAMRGENRRGEREAPAPGC